MTPTPGETMFNLARASLLALTLLGCNRASTSHNDNAEPATTVPTTVPAADVPAMPIVPVPVAPTAAPAIPVAPGDGGAPAMPTAPMPTPNAPDSAVAPGAVEPSTPPPAAPMPTPNAAPAPGAESPTPAAQPTTPAPAANTGSAPRNSEVLNVPGVGAVRMRQDRNSTSVNVGGIRINLPMQR